MAQRKFQSRTLFLAAFAICAAWPSTLAILWLTTGKMVPTVNVRWVPGITSEQRSRTEGELSLVWYEPKEPRTVSYFLIDENQENLKRIIVHPLVEDTASINRGTFVLEHPPHARMWVGRRFTTPWPSAMLYLSLVGCLISGVLLGLRD